VVLRATLQSRAASLTAVPLPLSLCLSVRLAASTRRASCSVRAAALGVPRCLHELVAVGVACLRPAITFQRIVHSHTPRPRCPLRARPRRSQHALQRLLQRRLVRGRGVDGVGGVGSSRRARSGDDVIRARSGTRIRRRSAKAAGRRRRWRRRKTRLAKAKAAEAGEGGGEGGGWGPVTATRRATLMDWCRVV